MTGAENLTPNADDSQSQSDSGPYQWQQPTSGPAARDSIAGNRQSHISAGGHVVGGSYSNSKKTSINFGGVVLLIAIVVVLIFVGKWIAGRAIDAVTVDPITAQTTCSEYMKRPDQERAAAVRAVGMELKNPNAGNPLMFNEVDYECGSNPTVKLGRILRP